MNKEEVVNNVMDFLKYFMFTFAWLLAFEYIFDNSTEFMALLWLLGGLFYFGLLCWKFGKEHQELKQKELLLYYAKKLKEKELLLYYYEKIRGLRSERSRK